MKRNLVYLILVTSLLLGGIIACQESSISLQEKISDYFLSNSEKVKIAQIWYKGNDPFQRLSRAAKPHVLFDGMVPFWEEAFTDGNDEYTTVEIPISTINRKLITSSESSLKYKETGDSRFIQSFTRLVIKLDKIRRDTVGFFMTVIPSVEYLKRTNFNSFYNTYCHRDNSFSGYIIFHELDGRLANGWKYMNGIITKEVHVSNYISVNSLTAGIDCVMKCQEIYEEICTESHTVTEWGDSVTEKKCEIKYVKTECWEECVPGSGESGSEGDYRPSENDPCKICKCFPCVCPITIDCDDDAVQTTEKANNNYGYFKEQGLEEKFINKYQQSDVEWGTTLEYNAANNTYIITQPKTDNSTNNVSLNYRYDEKQYTVASIHNHPKSTPFSYKDVLFTARVALNSRWKYTTTFVQTKSGEIYALSIQDSTKVKKFLMKSESDSTVARTFENMYKVLYKSALDQYDYGIDDRIERELQLYAFAGTLDLGTGPLQTGLKVSRLDDNEFKNKKLIHSMESDGNGGIKYKIVKKISCK